MKNPGHLPALNCKVDPMPLESWCLWDVAIVPSLKNGNRNAARTVLADIKYKLSVLFRYDDRLTISHLEQSCVCRSSQAGRQEQHRPAQTVESKDGDDEFEACSCEQRHNWSSGRKRILESVS